MDILDDEENFDIELALELLQNEIEQIQEDENFYREAAKEVELLNAQEALALKLLGAGTQEDLEKAQHLIQHVVAPEF